mgnify:FL=1
MRKLFVIWLFLLACVSSSYSQDVSREEFENIIIEINSQLPMSMGPTMTWESMSMKDKEVFCKFQINDIGNTLSKMQLSEEQLKNNIKMMLAGSDDTKKLFQTIAELGLNFHVSMVSENTGDSREVIFTPAELRECVESGVSLDVKVNMILEATKPQLPVTLMAGMTIINMQKQDGFIVTVIEVDENQYNLAGFQSKKALEGIENYANTDMATQYQWQLFAEAGLGVRYTYIGSISKKSINLDIPNQRLKELKFPTPK